jgi:hypothetical protein
MHRIHRITKTLVTPPSGGRYDETINIDVGVFEYMTDVQLLPPSGDRMAVWLEKQPEVLQNSIAVDPQPTGAGLLITVGALVLRGWADDHSLAITAEFDGECWDCLLSLDVKPVLTSGVYHCACCPDGQRQVFDTVEDLLCDHLWRPLAMWVQKAALPAIGVAFFRRGGATWAKLIYTVDDAGQAAHVIYA